MERQGIPSGKYKIFCNAQTLQNFSSGDSGDDTPGVRLRSTGQAGDVAINHAHFRPDQKNSETGVSQENLRWVVKFYFQSEPTRFDQYEQVLHDPETRTQIDQVLRKVLQEGGALELAIDQMRNVLLTKLITKRGLPSVHAKFALHRTELLENARVVVGEKTLLNTGVPALDRERKLDTTKKPATDRKYQDFVLAPPQG